MSILEMANRTASKASLVLLNAFAMMKAADFEMCQMVARLAIVTGAWLLWVVSLFDRRTRSRVWAIGMAK